MQKEHRFPLCPPPLVIHFFLRVNDFEDVAGEFVEVVNGENSEGDETPRSLNLSDVAANAHQSVLSKHLKEDN